ncbi:MAG TPA: type II toxin-antitoxin system VapC family toxin [Anaerolineales bacterium]|jgi:predicted nucleic acid-binding protein|nr:type II toxin-antitoxin system VapC family toxin [Anaerolineales bacterium]
MTDSIVVDANLFLSQILPLPYSNQAAAQLEVWKIELAHLMAPVLWEYEIASGLRRAVSERLLSPEEAETALETLFEMDVETIRPTPALHRRAFRWAARLQQNKAYDGQYLALAEELGAVFWSADKRLVNRMRQLGINWVYGIA